MPSGGKRAGAGRPRKPLETRIKEGVDTVSHKKPKVLKFDNQNQTEKSNKVSMPPEFLNQGVFGFDVSELPSATEIYNATEQWIIRAGCEQFIMKSLIEDFAYTRRSFLESETACKKLGRFYKDEQGKWQNTPWVKQSIEYNKACLGLYREIWNIVAQNSTTEYSGLTAKDNSFIDLLTRRGL